MQSPRVEVARAAAGRAPESKLLLYGEMSKAKKIM